VAQLVLSAHPVGWWLSPSTANRARFTAAARSWKSAATLVVAAYAGAAAAVFSAHQVADLAFDLGTGLCVIGAPGRVGLPGAGGGELPLVLAEMDRASRAAAGAPVRERAAGAEPAEAGDLSVLDRS
jgi:hypothetical protein